MIIRDEQREVFRGERRFEEKLGRFLRDRFPAFCAQYDEAEFTRFLESGIARAEAYGILRECDIARFFDVLIPYEVDFITRQEPDWCANILDNRSLEAAERLRRIQLIGQE